MSVVFSGVQAGALDATNSTNLSKVHAAGSVMGSYLSAGDLADSAGSKVFASFAVEGAVWDELGKTISETLSAGIA